MQGRLVPAMPKRGAAQALLVLVLLAVLVKALTSCMLLPKPCWASSDSVCLCIIPRG